MHKRKIAKWLIGQAVKTPPSHGGNRGSIPLSAATVFNSPTLKDAGNLEFTRFVAFFIFAERGFYEVKKVREPLREQLEF